MRLKKVKNVHILVFVCIVYIFISAIVSYYVSIKRAGSIIDSCVYQQRNLLNDIKSEFELLLPDDMENAEVIDKIFKYKDVYGFVYRDNMVIYEIDIETTEKYKNSTTRELFNDYSQDSGNEIVDNMTDIMFKEEGTEYLTKDNIYGKEIVTWKNVEAYGKNYIIGVAVPVYNVLNDVNYYLYRNIFIIISVINYVVVGSLCYYIIKLHKKMTA